MLLASISRPCVAFVASAVACVCLGRPVIRAFISLKWTQPFRHDDCPQLKPLHEQKRGTPTMGGLFVLAMAVGVAILLGGLDRLDGWLTLLAVAGMGLLGYMDDLLKIRFADAKGLKKRPKLIVALGLGAVIGWLTFNPSLGYREVALPWIASRVDVGWLWIPLAMAVIAGSAHAVNLTDGMDGLAAGTLTVAFSAFALLALAQSGDVEQGRVLATWCASFAGASAGFLWFNAHPAAVFMGDVGALGLGAALGVLALLSHQALGLVIVGGVFVAEALSVMLQVASYRWRNGRRIFRVAPLHHHVELGGVSAQSVVVRFWLAGVVLAALGILAFS